MDFEEAFSGKDGGVFRERGLIFLGLIPSSLLFLNILKYHGQVVHNVLFTALFDPKDLGSLIEQVAREAHVYRGLDLVTSEHPKFDSGVLDGSNGLRSPIL